VEILSGGRGWGSVLLGRSYAPDGGLAAAEKAGAWAAWKRAVTQLSPNRVVRLVTDSGLRGRGGAGFPTGDKWRACASTESNQRYAVANGYEADPGAQLDRTLMERDPHAVIEGLALAAYAVGATRAFVVIRAGATTAATRLRAAIAVAEEAGYIGTNVLRRGFDLSIELREISGGFFHGEETAVLRAIENKRAQPEQRPPYPATVGLWTKPTVVNNVETLAAVPWIVANGASDYAGMGRDGTAGTTLVQVTGSVARAGIIEAPLGSRLDELVELAGGASDGEVKAVLVGGPSGGFLPADRLATRLSPTTLQEAGSILGSGTIVVVGRSACVVDLASLMTRYVSDQACGKTIPCRIGTRRLAEIGDRFTSGLPRPTDPQLLLDLAADCRDGALCGLEATAGNPLTTGMRYFAQEFEDHIVRSTCPAGVCRPLRVAAGSIH
jgi:NADH:ubiquinone oxidoreductase subunit F (NADH-binding)